MAQKAIAAPPQTPTNLTVEQFLKATDQKTVRLQSSVPYVDNQVQRIPLPQTGLASVVWLNIQGSVTVAGTVTGGTFQGLPYPAFMSILRRLKFYNNNAFQLIDLSGWGLYKWVRERTGIDFITTNNNTGFSTNVKQGLGQNLTNPVVPGANVTAGTYNFAFSVPVPLAYNEAGEQGLLVLQQNSTFYTIELDWGQVTGGLSATGGTNDMFNALVGTGLAVTSNISASLELDYFEWLPGTQDLTSMFMSVSESIVSSPVAAGDNTYKIPVQDFYTMLMLEVVNNGAAVPFGQISNIQFKYGGNIYKFQEDYLPHLVRSYYQHEAMPPVDGNIVFDFGIRRGMLNRRDRINAFNNQNITNAEIHFSLPGTITIAQPSQVSVIAEKLTYTQQ